MGRYSQAIWPGPDYRHFAGATAQFILLQLRPTENGAALMENVKEPISAEMSAAGYRAKQRAAAPGKQDWRSMAMN